MRRRDLLLGGAAAATGCSRFDDPPSPLFDGDWIGASHERGHRLRDGKSGSLPPPALRRRAGVLIVGAGIAGLAAARRLRNEGIDDVHLLELENEAGGNSRGHRLAGRACPLGAHYLPTPGPAATEVTELLHDLGVLETKHGRPVYDETMLCHSPQERLFIDGQWQDGLLPAARDERLRAQYRGFGRAIERLRGELAFAIPTTRAAWSAGHAALDAQTFAQWLAAQGFDHPRLRWYLDYCCRDDYGASASQVSAWAGVHYFASRHGFHAPGVDDDAERADDHDAVLTWPEGNGWLAERLAGPHEERLHTGRIALRISETRYEVQVDAWSESTRQVERWTAPRVVLALPLFIAARLLDAPPPGLAEAAALMPHAPWLVANLHLRSALTDRPGAPMSWDNVLYDERGTNPSLGYVDATHQALLPVADPVLLTAYWALGGRHAEELRQQRQALLARPWRTWANVVVDDLSRAHPDLRRKLDRVELMRYGHAMSVPVPGLRGHAALRALSASAGRVHLAHSDLSAYSVFEEAFFHGHRAGGEIAAVLKGSTSARSG